MKRQPYEKSFLELKNKNGVLLFCRIYFLLTKFFLCGEEGEKQKAFLETVCSTESGNRAVGCMVGMGIADAVGHPFEFLPVVDTPSQYVFSLGNYTDENNAFQLERGQWTDE